ncbi:MAG: chorismate mutase, partial [Rhodospirillaceae bacterium]|nr:chorismate mutase [Rhodospirillaceae bacterium]
MKTLEELRSAIDAIDVQIHDLIMQRTEIIEGVRGAKKGDKIKIRAAREAEIIYRLLERHKGPFPRRELVRIWRELINATLSSEGPFSVGVFVGEDCEGFWDLARDQYGSFTPMTQYASTRRLVEVVQNQEVTLGILPIPVRRDNDPWWRRLATTVEGTPRIIARLPFAGPGNARSAEREALVICPVEMEPTGRDCTYMVFESGGELTEASFARAAKESGFDVLFATDWDDPTRPQIWLKLVEVDGFVEENDPRIDVVREKCKKIGGDITRVMKLGG